VGIAAVPIPRQVRNNDVDLAGKYTTDDDVLIVSYSRYCRYRAALCRLTEPTGSSSVVDALSPRLLAAIGLTADLPPPSTSSTVRVLFCRATVVHPALQKHAFRLDELGTFSV